MIRNKGWAKFLRFIGVVLMGLTVAFTILSRVGTTCIALAAEIYGDKWAPLVPFKWLYILFVIATVTTGVMGVRAVVMLIKGRPNAYRFTLIALGLGILVDFIHMLVSRSLRGSSMPVDPVVYTTVLTLVVFLIYRIPTIWQGVDYERSQSEDSNADSAAAIVMGILVLTIQYWMDPTHTSGGVNYADVWHTTLLVIGSLLVITGIGTAVLRLDFLWGSVSMETRIHHVE